MLSIVRPAARRLLVCALLAAGVAEVAGVGRAAVAQAPPPGLVYPAPAGALLEKLEKLRVLGSVLYLAAHPDDENTALIATFSRGSHYRTGYLAMTRGDGGQNLIGPEQGERVGVIRTQELLAARRIDGGEQFFTRAIDFGYSKSPEETLAIWGHDAVLSDVVRVIRTFRPDVIVTRFPTDGSGGHGHHTASALLAAEAFRAAGDPTRFPEQLKTLTPWQPKRLFWNAWRRDGGETPGAIRVDVGAYDPLLGRSYTEIAAESRSMHKSQGFGSAERRGTFPQELLLTAGDPAVKDPLEGIDVSWRRVPGGEAVDAPLAKAVAEFDPRHPDRSVPRLLEADAALAKLPAGAWVDTKRAELLDAIRSATGLWLEAMAARPAVTPGEELKVTLTALNRSDVPLTLEGVDLTDAAGTPPSGGNLADNRPWKADATLALPADFPLPQPYWLVKPATKGLFQVDDPSLIGKAEAPPPVVARFRLRAGGETLTYVVPVLYRRTDPVAGEVVRPLEVLPRVNLRFADGVVLFPGAGSRPVTVEIGDGGGTPQAVSGSVRITAGPGWTVSPPSQPFTVEPGGRARVTFSVTPPAAPGTVTLRAEADAGGARFTHEVVRIDYPHIPLQTLYPEATARAVRLDVATRGGRLGYVMGPGDDVPATLRQLGYAVDLLDEDDLLRGDLSRYGTIVTGVRAYNTRPELKAAEPRLLAWVEKGGTLVVQYNTSQQLVTDELGPFPLKLSHDRVTVEESPVRLLAPASPLLTTPNRITASDFDGWVQERGLYFPGSWDPRYATVLEVADPGESPKAGSLLFARSGKGAFVYTGLAFFRQLPAGVPGAIRLFANLVSARGSDG